MTTDIYLRTSTEEQSPENQLKDCKELAQKLDPAFRERLKQHVFKVGDPSTYSAEVILRVQTEVCIEALLHAIHDEDGKRVSNLLNQLVTIDPKNTP